MQWLRLSRRRMLQAMGALGAAVSIPSRAPRADSNVLRVRDRYGLNSLDPAYMNTELLITRAIYTNLVQYKPFTDKWEWELDAAESIEQVDPTHIRFTLRPNIMWTNGFGEMTTEDVKFSYERHIDPDVASHYAGFWETLDRVDIIDKYSGVIVMKEPYVPIWMNTLCFLGGIIICKEAWKPFSEGNRINVLPPSNAGPYSVKEWKPEERIVLERNPGWPGPHPDFDEIQVYPITDDKTAEIAFEAGELDFTHISASSAPGYIAEPPPGSNVIVNSMVGFEWVGINTEHPPFDDIRVRQAVQRAVDVDQVIEAEHFGLAVRGTGIAAPGLVGHRESLLHPGRNVEEAKRLLAEAGYPDGFKTTIALINSTDRVSAAQVMQANLAEVGIELDIQPLDDGTYWTLGLEEEGDSWKDIQMFHAIWWLLPDASSGTMWFVPEQIGLWNWERWPNEEFGRLHQQGIVEYDEKKRHEIYVRMQDLMEESGAYLFLAHPPTAAIYRDTIIPALLADGSNLIIPRCKKA